MKFLNFFNNKNEIFSASYTVKLRRRNEEQSFYTMTHIPAKSQEEAEEKAKRYVAENGYWSACLNISERMSCLVTVEAFQEDLMEK